MASARTFDLKLTTKNGPEFTFTGINKEEHELVEDFLKSKKLRIKNEIPDDMATAVHLDDSDDEMQSIASDDGAATKSRLLNNDEDDSEQGKADPFPTKCSPLTVSFFQMRISKHLNQMRGPHHHHQIQMRVGTRRMHQETATWSSLLQKIKRRRRLKRMVTPRQSQRAVLTMGTLVQRRRRRWQQSRADFLYLFYVFRCGQPIRI